MNVEEYRKFMNNTDNKGKCKNCPENREMKSSFSEDRKPCGQYRCWVAVHCEEE